jgi:outer membrane lipoprotein
MRSHRSLVFWVLSLWLMGCSYPISKQVREELTKDVTFPMVLKNPSAYEGDTVLWGGFIIETVNLKEGVEIFVLDTPLDHWEEPEAERYSRGRFIAKTAKFLDPAVYKAGKKITLAGKIAGAKTVPLGQTKYTYPVVSVIQLHLWKEEHYYPYYYYPYYYPWGGPNSWWYGYGPYYGPYYGPFYRPDYDDEEEGRHEEGEGEEEEGRDRDK